VVVRSGGRLVVAGGTQVEFSEDRLGAGLDPERAELVVEGALNINPSGGAEVRFTSGLPEPMPGDWYGIFVAPRARISARATTIEYPLIGLGANTLEGNHLLDGLSIRRAGRGLVLEDLVGEVELIDLDVRDCRGAAVVVRGRGSLRMPSPALLNNGGAGLARSGGELEFSRGELTGNGIESTQAANMELGPGTFGQVTNNTFRGAIGMRLSTTREVLIRDNSFADHEVGIIAHSSRPQILNNRFARNRLAIELSGEIVPARLELNTIHDSEELLVNHSALEVVAINNWWGTRDASRISSRILGPVVWQPFLNFDPRNPVNFGLAQSYPNPFNGSTIIEFTVGLDDAVIEEENGVLLEVRSTSGALVRRLVRETAFPGVYSVTWDGRDEGGDQVATGVYYYWLRIGSTVVFRKLMVLR
jgi:hypothetical protein